MWLFTNKGFVSVVQHRDHPNQVIVRARYAGDIESLVRVLPGTVQHTPENDYPYRIVMTKERLSEIMYDFVQNIDYDNFKNSVKDHRRNKVWSKVWSLLLDEYQVVDSLYKWATKLTGKFDV